MKNRKKPIIGKKENKSIYAESTVLIADGDLEQDFLFSFSIGQSKEMDGKKKKKYR